MKVTSIQTFAQKLLQKANVNINGTQPWDMKVFNDNLYARVARQGTLGLGEAYMDEWWQSEQLDEFFARVIAAGLEKYVKKNQIALFYLIANRLFNFQTKRLALKVGKKHYDLGNEFYQLMLDKTMTYSCGYWKNAQDLDQAQLNKLELICQKLYLQPGMRLLDIGCGWGGLAKYAAENYGVEVVGVTISKKQQQLAAERCKNLPVSIRFQDYRDINEKFDRIVSVGMFEHVGYKNYATYMQTVNRCLQDEGLFLLHTIGSNHTGVNADPWIIKYIFTNSMLPSIKQIAAASEKLFVMEDWQNFSADYDKTLMAWHGNFKKNWGKIKDKFDERFYRMWSYYLLSCAGAFRARSVQLWQIVFSKEGVPGGYVSVR